MIVSKPDATPIRIEYHRVLNQVAEQMPADCRVLSIGATDVYDYAGCFPPGAFETLDRDAGTQPTHVGRIEDRSDLGVYDLILVFGVFEYLDDYARAIANCETMLAVDGKMIVGIARTPKRGTHYTGDARDLSQMTLVEATDVQDYTIALYEKSKPAGATMPARRRKAKKGEVGDVPVSS